MLITNINKKLGVICNDKNIGFVNNYSLVLYVVNMIGCRRRKAERGVWEGREKATSKTGISDIWFKCYYAWHPFHGCFVYCSPVLYSLEAQLWPWMEANQSIPFISLIHFSYSFLFQGSMGNKKKIYSPFWKLLQFLINEKRNLASCNLCHYHPKFFGF